MQETKILKHLQKKSLTQLEALNLYGCMRLGARIYDLRNKGYNIKTVKKEYHGKHGKKMFAEYFLIKKK
jgi:hypothetical protein